MQVSADILYASRRKIHPSISVRIGLHWQWMLVKDIIMEGKFLNESYELVNVDTEGRIVRG